MGLVGGLHSKKEGSSIHVETQREGADRDFEGGGRLEPPREGGARKVLGKGGPVEIQREGGADGD